MQRRRPALRRPAARPRVARGRASAEPEKDTWLSLEDEPLEGLRIGERLHMRMSYGGVQGEAIGG